MHFPVTISISDNPIYLHTILEWLSYFIGYRYYIYLRNKHNDLINTNNRTSIFLGALLGGLIGSRLIGSLENFDLLQQNKHQLFLYVYGNKTILGGLLFGTWGVEVVKKIIGEKNSSGDMMTYPIILALIIGRIGCFSMGVYEETYGIPFKYGVNLGDGILRHPVTLYEIVFLIFIWISSLKIFKHSVFANGNLYKYFMINYLIFRFLLDFIKPHYNLILHLSTIQITCLIGLLYYSKAIIQAVKKLMTNG